MQQKHISQAWFYVASSISGLEWDVTANTINTFKNRLDKF